MATKEKKLELTWTEDQLIAAMDAVQKDGMSVRKAVGVFKIPRTTLRNHLASGSRKKIKGRKPILTNDQEMEICRRIHRLADAGVPVTPTFIKRTIYNFCTSNKIENPFNESTCMAGRKWLKLFLGRHCDVAVRKSQNMNSARAQKLNRFVVADHFQKLLAVMNELNLIKKPQSIYNMDEKRTRLCLHKQQTVLARKGAKRIHNIAPEHGENVTVVACGNALGNVIPPVVLFKGERMKPEWRKNLPPGSDIFMTPKGSMTSQTFVKWLAHFAKYKTPGPNLLIFDGVNSHLDANVVLEADAHDVTLYCLPSNTTHELQPFDKSVFKAFESYWDDEIMLYWTRISSSNNRNVNKFDHTIRRSQFGKIFTEAWNRAVTPKNVSAGFEETGIYPFNPNRIPDEAYSSNDLSHKARIQAQPENPESNPEVGIGNSESGVVAKVEVAPQAEKSLKRASSAREEDSISLSDSDYTVNNSDDSLDLDVGNVENSVTISKLMKTQEAPEKKSVTPRRKALNYRAQKVVVSLSQSKSKVIPSAVSKKTGQVVDKLSKTEETAVPGISGLQKPSKFSESWYCHLCRTDRKIDMRFCTRCKRYVHEECEGLTVRNKIPDFVCTFCQDSD